MTHRIEKSAQEELFLRARSYNAWLDKPVEPELLEELYALTRMGPTSMNSLPARFIFIISKAGKEKLKPALSAGNIDKTMNAPVTVIVAYDKQFYKNLPRLYPHVPNAEDKFAKDTLLADTTAFRNGTLQGAYLMIAARALGLDCGPMSGFKNAVVDAVFFPDGHWRSNFLLNLGYGDGSALHQRGPRLDFAEACLVI